MKNINSYSYCYICYGITEPNMICDRCDNLYCDECSYSFTQHYQFHGARCFECSGQSRLNPLFKNIYRKNRIDSILNKLDK